MRPQVKYILFFSFLVAQVLVAQQHNNSVKEKKVVFIIVDGIATDMLQKASTPYLDGISAGGSYSKAYVGGKKMPTQKPQLFLQLAIIVCLRELG
ncbi:hypothetical protein M601_018345 [Cellulophaga baltica 4]|nr:hypothetical protein M601_018345 [Cellulophaga baltica 4]